MGHLFQRPPEIAPEIAERLQSIRRINPDLNSCKGIGHVRLMLPEGTLSARMAWAAEKPSRLRVQILGFTGQPIQSFAFNGKRMFLVSHLDRRFYSKKKDNPSLIKMIGIDIHADDVIELLCGRPPLIPFRMAELIKGAAESEPDVLILSGGKLIEKIYHAPGTGWINKIEVLEKNGRLIYRASIDEFRQIGGFQVPARLALADADHNGLSLEIDRCWPNAALETDLFVLAKPL